MLVQVDVWGGDRSLDHLARYRCELFDPRIERDLCQGYLVNLIRVQDIMDQDNWRDEPEFDVRVRQ